MDEAKRLRLRAMADRALADNITRYRMADKQVGGFFSLAELLSEQHDRCKIGMFDTLGTAQAIVSQAAASPDGVTTYGAIWNVFRPDTPWRVFPGRREVTNALERVQYYCLRNGLPLLATLVVNAGERELTPEAKANIAQWARDNGILVDGDPDDFIANQQSRARTVAFEQLS